MATVDWNDGTPAPLDVLLEERSVIQKELDWLLRTEVPSVFMQLGIMLKQCSQLLTGTTQNASENACTLPITTVGDAFKGYLTIEGCRITKAEVSVRFSKWNKSVPFQAVIGQNKPWVISQVQNAANYVQLALSEIDDSSLQNGIFHTKERVYAVMERVMSFLRKAKDQMVLPSLQFPANIYELSEEVFTPKLPQDLFIDFQINYANLSASVYAVSFLGVNQAPRKVSASARKKSDSRIGYVHEQVGMRLEVIDHEEVELQVKPFFKALTIIRYSHELCQRMRDKVVALVL